MTGGYIGLIALYMYPSLSLVPRPTPFLVTRRKVTGPGQVKSRARIGNEIYVS